MINKKFIDKLKEEYQSSDQQRRQIISISNEILYLSKKTIFSIHRDSLKEAKSLISDIEQKIGHVQTKFGWARAYQEGSFTAAMEEYVEARLFFSAIEGKTIQAIPKTKLGYTSYLGGLCDMTGELVRRATNQAAKHNWKEVDKIKDIIDETMSALLEFDLGGYLRTKYDQARGNLRKIEQISYEIALKTKK